MNCKAPDRPPNFSMLHQSRSRALMLTLGAVYVALAGLWAGLNAHPAIIAALALATVPALVDLWRNPSASITIDECRLAWRFSRRAGEIDLSDIDYVVFTTRIDFSTLVTVVDRFGKKQRLPQPCTVAHHRIEGELVKRGIRTKRTHFHFK